MGRLENKWEKGLKMTKNCFRRGNGSLPQIYIKETLQNPQNETKLNHMRPACFYCDIFHLQAKVSPQKITLREILPTKINSGGVGIRLSWVENF